jgi:hypothetical protein
VALVIAHGQDCLRSEKMLLGEPIGHVKLKLGMETGLNLVWALLAVVLVRLWVRYAPRKGASQRMQVATLAMLILILFPVISVTDDLVAAQNPADVEIYMRRGHTAGIQHVIFPVVATLPPVVFGGLFFGHQRLAAPSCLPVPTVDNPALAGIQNRPPPTV